MTVSAEIAKEELRSIVVRLERNAEERALLADDRRRIMQHAKSLGFVPAAINAVLRRRAMDPATRDELDMLVACYGEVVGLTGGMLDRGELERVGGALSLPSPPLTNTKLGKTEAGVAAWLDGGET